LEGGGVGDGETGPGERLVDVDGSQGQEWNAVGVVESGNLHKTGSWECG
jgi:hypothetical protein